jgi:ATP-dependent DNA helicase RecG
VALNSKKAREGKLSKLKKFLAEEDDIKRDKMTLDEITKLTSNMGQEGELKTVEFKSTTADLKGACQTLCGFLNHEGGVVLIGVKNDGRLVGQTVTDRTRQEIANEIKKIEPFASVEVNYVPFGEKKSVISLKVLVGTHRPYVYDARPYQRIESTTCTMPQYVYERLLIEREQLNHTWERFNADKYTLSDLDHNLILSVIHKSVKEQRLAEMSMREDIPIVLQKLELIEHGHIKNAAVALFGKKFLPNYPQCHLKMARFKGVDRHEFLDNEQLYGNIFELLDRAMLFINRHLPVAAKIVPGQLERVEKPLIPLEAIRESLINAFCHRNYSTHGGSIKLAIYDDKMEVINTGGLLPGVTLEKIKQGFSELRNPLIADILFRCRLIEGWGRGIKEIIKECIEAGDPEPQFECDEYYFQVIFKFPINMKPEVILIDQTSKAFEKLNDRQKAIVKILSETTESRAADIMARLGQSFSERTIRRDLVALKKLGIIDSSGHAWTAVWFLKSK